jgi:hypothetical protein
MLKPGRHVYSNPKTGLAVLAYWTFMPSFIKKTFNKIDQDRAEEAKCRENRSQIKRPKARSRIKYANFPRSFYLLA